MFKFCQTNFCVNYVNRVRVPYFHVTSYCISNSYPNMYGVCGALIVGTYWLYAIKKACTTQHLHQWGDKTSYSGIPSIHILADARQQFFHFHAA